MAKVQLLDGSVVTAPLTDVKAVGDEGSKSAIAHINGRAFPVYNSIIDGFNGFWHEQLEPLKLEEDHARQERLNVAGAFFAQYIDGMVGEVPAEAIIESVAELISYGGDLAQIRQMMALEVEEDEEFKRIQAIGEQAAMKREDEARDRWLSENS